MLLQINWIRRSTRREFRKPLAIKQKNGALPTPKKCANHCLLYSVTPNSLAGEIVDERREIFSAPDAQAIISINVLFLNSLILSISYSYQKNSKAKWREAYP